MNKSISCGLKNIIHDEWIPALHSGLESHSGKCLKAWECRNGFNISKSEKSIQICTDNFGTVPVYFDAENKIFSHSIKELPAKINSCEDIDQVGFWEGMIFDYPFLNRTMNKNVIQLQGGAEFNYDLNSNCWSSKRWNYFNSPPCGIKIAEDTVNAIDARLEQLCKSYWEMLPHNATILLPLSGGLDSRLLAVHLAQTGDPKRIRAVTFGYSKNSLEFRIANKTCKILGIDFHYFHPLSHRHYIECVDDFWDYGQGCLSVLHAHLFSFLRENIPENTLLVTGFFCDPIAGYAAQNEANKIASFDLKATKTHQKLFNESERLSINKDIYAQMLNDVNIIFEEWKANEPIYGFDEYLYQSQRQSKTFSPLLQMYRSFCPVATPFADPDLVKMFLGLPYGFRKEKYVIRQLISLRSNELLNIGDLSSSISTSNSILRGRAYWRQWITRGAMSLNIISNDTLRLVSPYLTEDLFGSMRKECMHDITSVCEKFRNNKIIDGNQFNILNKKAINSREAAIHARLLTFSPLAKHK